MSAEKLRQLATQFLQAIGSGAPPEEIAALCTPDLDWRIPGNDGVLPWIGHQKGRDAVANFVRNSRSMLERIRFEVNDILASDDHAVILGELATRVRATGKVIETEFGIVLAFSGDRVSTF